MALGKSLYVLNFKTNAGEALAPARREIALVKKIQMESIPPAERYQKALAKFATLSKRAELTAKQHAHGLRELAKEDPARIAVIESDTRMQKIRDDQMKRGIATMRSMETAQERLTRRLLGNDAALKRGNISLETHRRRVIALRAEYRRTTASAGMFGKAISFGTLASTIGSLAGVTVGVASVGIAARSAGRQYAEFTQELARSTAIMDDTPEQFKRIKQAAIDATFGLEATAAQGAEGFFFLASAGLSVEESLAAIPITAKFAQAGQFDLAQSTDLLTDAQSALGLNFGTTAQKMEAMKDIGNVLVKANQKANASVEQFSTALTTKAGAALKLVNKDIREGVAILSVFADQGLKGAEAGTALNIVLRDMTTKSVKFAEAWERNGLAVFDANGEMLKTHEIIAQLERKFDTLSTKAKKELFLELGFSDKSLVFTQMLVGTSEKLKQLEANFNDVSGVMDQVADDSMSPLTKALNVVKDGWSEFAVTVGEPLVSGLVGTDGDSLEGSIRNFNKAMEDAGPIMEDLGRGVRVVGETVGGVAGSVGELTVAFSKLNESINPFLEFTSGQEQSGILQFWARNSAGITEIVTFFASGSVIGKIWRDYAAGGFEAAEATGKVATEVERLAMREKRLEEALASIAKRKQGEAERVSPEDIAAGFDEEKARIKAEEDLATSIEKAEDRLKTQIDTLMLGEAAMERYTLATNGATESELALYDQLSSQLDQMEQSIQAEEDLAKARKKAKDDAAKTTQELAADIDDLTRALEREIATEGMSADQIAIWDLRNRGALDTELAKIEALQAEAHAHDELRGAAKGSFAAMAVGSREAEEALARGRAAAMSATGDTTEGTLSDAMDDIFGPSSATPDRAMDDIFGPAEASVAHPIAKPSDEDTALLKKQVDLQKKIAKGVANPLVIEEVTLS